MGNVLNEEKKQQVLALGRLGWSLRQIQKATRIRRETVSAYLKAAGIAVRPPGAWGRRAPKPANEVITDFGAAKPTVPVISEPHPNPKNLSRKGKSTSKPANENGVITGFGVELSATEPETSAKVRSTSFCEPYRDAIELGLSRGRNARAIWQDLVSEYGFANNYQSVQRFVRKLPLTAAEDLLEITMRRYERTSTMLTSNRPVEDWGKLLGDAAAISAMLDRLLHHGHVLKCGPRSWRTKTDLPPQEPAG